jgi:hypothetical protein
MPFGPDSFPFIKPPSVKGLPQLKKADQNYHPRLPDLIFEALGSPLGLGEDTSGMNPEARNATTRAGAFGDLASMLLPLGLVGEEAKATATGIKALHPSELAGIRQSIQGAPSLREFMAVGAEPQFVRGQGADLALKLAKKNFPNRAKPMGAMQ